MIGTIVNTATILLGSFIGSNAKKGIKEEYKGAVFTAMGIGNNGIAESMPLSITYPTMNTQYCLLSACRKQLINTIIDIEGRFQRLSKRFSSSDLGQGLSTATLILASRALSVPGPIEALHGDHTFLFTNAIGFRDIHGVCLRLWHWVAIAAGILFCWQGAIYLIASL